MNIKKHLMVMGMIISVARQDSFAQIFQPLNETRAKAEVSRELTIGDRLPNIQFSDVVNYKTTTAKFSDFKAKLTILDFWSSSCSSCIELFTHMQNLKDQFKGQLSIVLVNGNTKTSHDNDELVRKILEKQQALTGVKIQLPVVLNCKALDADFRYRVIPHEVWIDENGLVVAITSESEVTAKNIKAVLEGKELHMHIKKDFIVDMGAQSLSELVYQNPQLFTRPLCSSIIYKGFIDGLGGYGFRKQSNGYVGWFIINSTLLEIYRSAYRDLLSKFPDNRILVEVSDSLKFQEVNYRDTTKYSRVYSYDISFSPITDESMIFRYAQIDLEKVFHTRVKTEKRLVDCYILKGTSELERSYSKGGPIEWKEQHGSSIAHIQNFPIHEMVDEFNRTFSLPLINETGLAQNIDLDLPSSELNTTEMINVLKKAGFEVRKEKRLLDVGVITDNKE